MLEENYMTVYVKMINEKTISIKCHRNWTATVISDEVERRSSIPRDMIRLVHKGKMLSEKKTMKENNIEAEATIEMSLRLLGGMEVIEQMDTHETEEDGEKVKVGGRKRRKSDETKRRHGLLEKRHYFEALRRSDEKWIATQERLDEKWKATQERLTKNSKLSKKDRRKNE